MNSIGLPGKVMQTERPASYETERQALGPFTANWSLLVRFRSFIRKPFNDSRNIWIEFAFTLTISVTSTGSHFRHYGKMNFCRCGSSLFSMASTQPNLATNNWTIIPISVQVQLRDALPVRFCQWLLLMLSTYPFVSPRNFEHRF
jgi:hypothetical protein